MEPSAWQPRQPCHESLHTKVCFCYSTIIKFSFFFFSVLPMVIRVQATVHQARPTNPCHHLCHRPHLQATALPALSTLQQAHRTRQPAQATAQRLHLIRPRVQVTVQPVPVTVQHPHHTGRIKFMKPHKCYINLNSLQPDKPKLLSDESILLSHEPVLLSHFTILLANESQLFANKPKLQPNISIVQSH